MLFYLFIMAPHVAQNISTPRIHTQIIPDEFIMKIGFTTEL